MHACLIIISYTTLLPSGSLQTANRSGQVRLLVFGLLWVGVIEGSTGICFGCCGSESQSDRQSGQAIDRTTEWARMSGAVERVTLAQFVIVLYHRIA